MKWPVTFPRPPPVAGPRLNKGANCVSFYRTAEKGKPLNHCRKTPRSFRTIITGAATAAAIFGSALVGATPADAGTRLGGVDMQRACTTQYPPEWGLSARVNDSGNSAWGLTGPDNDPKKAYSWRCWAPWDHSSYQIDVNRACVAQYGAGAYAKLGSSTNPYSWYCQR
jgi:hypothetical protein